MFFHQCDALHLCAIFIRSRYWYLVVGLPVVLGLTTLPFLLATGETLRNRVVFPQRTVLLWSILFTLTIYSLLPHKEFRFILPILPMCLYITSDYLSRWSRKANRYMENEARSLIE